MADSAEDVPRLLAAMKKVLELADEHAAAGTGFRHDGPQWWHLDPAEVREAISREITGKGESDA